MAGSAQLRTFCYKTTMCKFHTSGICTRGARCTFAHSADEMQPLPDLRHTRLCPALITGGRCPDPRRCQFAHSKAELRNPPMQGQRASPQATALELPRAPLDDRATDVSGRDRKSAALEHLKAPLDDSAADVSGSDTGTCGSQLDAESFSDEHSSGESSDGLEFKRAITLPVAPSMDRANPPPHKFCKTKMCSFYALGLCRNGGQCRFAHGRAELKPARCNSGAVLSPPFAIPPNRPGLLPIAADVKNTFINILTAEEERDRALALRRRGHSAPPCPRAP